LGLSMLIKFVIFIVVSILLFLFTLSRSHRHRYYRFFAFESLLVIVLLNTDTWFINPFSLIQIISWIFLAGSLFLAIHGFRLLRIAGSPKGDIEDTTELVTIGAYGYIRHPLYCSLFLGGVGAFLKKPSYPGFFFLIILMVFLYATARVEEIDNLKRFGSAYRSYMERTRMFIPFLV
jgi:protein-S-isoprenylcysteine O-methyltransferase Ste14